MSEWLLDDLTHLSRSADHLGSLANVLKDLGGPETILHELTQNADDAEGTTTVRFMVDSVALTVWNDGEFTNCGEQSSRVKTCPWKESRGRSCDLHSFRVFSGRHKSNDASTTGAFGVGFTCVYHVTDHPELVTAGTHLRLDEGASEGKRIEVCKDAGCGRDHDSPGTTFILPWARERSYLREELQVQPVSDEQIVKLEQALGRDASSTVLFLRRVSRIEIETPSETRTVIRESDDDIVRIGNGTATEEWLVLSGEYASSDALKQEFRDIEADRSQLVQVAIPVGESRTGRFYAGLPSQMPTGWHAHINGSFYPRTDRKGFEFADGTYRSEWNLDLLDSAAHLVAGGLQRIVEATGVTSTWTMLRDLERLGRDVSDGKLPAGFDHFFATVAEASSNAPILQMHDGAIRKPAGSLVPIDPDHYEGAHILQQLGLPIVAEPLRSLVLETKHTRYDIKQLTAGRLIEHLHQTDTWLEPWPAGAGPMSDDDMDRLLDLVEALLDRSKSWIEEPETAQLAVLPCAGSRYAPAEDAVRINDAALFELFTQINPDLLVVDVSRAEAHSPALLTLVPNLDLPTSLEALQGTNDTELLKAYADHLIQWFELHQPEIEQSAESAKAVRALPIFPTADGDRDSLENVSVPSDFEDIFAVASLNRPGKSGDSVPWEGWSHVREYVEEVSGRAA